MTRDQFVKYKFTAYMQINYIYPRSEAVVECMLLSVDFDCEQFKLQPFPAQEVEEFELLEKAFFAHIQFCELPIVSRLKITKR